MLSYNTTRREALKRLAAIGALAVLPSAAVWSMPSGRAAHFVGLGGAGFSLLAYFHDKLPNARYTWLDAEMPEQVPDYMNFVFAGTSDNLSVAVKSLFTGNEKFVLMAGLGGETGTRLIEELSFWLHQHQKDFAAICNLPFTFQGRIVRERAMQAEARLSSLPNFHCFDLDEIGRPSGHLLMGEVFEKADFAYYEIFSKQLHTL